MRRHIFSSRRLFRSLGEGDGFSIISLQALPEENSCPTRTRMAAASPSPNNCTLTNPLSPQTYWPSTPPRQISRPSALCAEGLRIGSTGTTPALWPTYRGAARRCACGFECTSSSATSPLASVGSSPSALMRCPASTPAPPTARGPADHRAAQPDIRERYEGRSD
jgi:hypothetical protein